MTLKSARLKKALVFVGEAIYVDGSMQTVKPR